jgi:hypothetical protein
LEVSIEYTNFRSFYGLTRGTLRNNGGVIYMYHLYPVAAPTRMRRYFWTDYPLKRILHKEDGVLITVNQVGYLGQVDFFAFVITLTSTLTFFALSTILVRYSAVYLMARRRFYHAEIYEQSIGYSKLGSFRADSSQGVYADMSVTQLRLECKSRYLAAGGTKEQLLVSGLQIQQLTQIHTITDYCLTFCALVSQPPQIRLYRDVWQSGEVKELEAKDRERSEVLLRDEIQRIHAADLRADDGDDHDVSSQPTAWVADAPKSSPLLSTDISLRPILLRHK